MKVKVSHPLEPNCYALTVMHMDRHTYNVPPDGTELDIFADNGQSWKFRLAGLPPITHPDPTNDSINAPVGGQVFQVSALQLLVPWMVLSAVLAGAVTVAALRRRR